MHDHAGSPHVRVDESYLGTLCIRKAGEGNAE